MKDVGGVAETRSWLARFKSACVITPIKNSRIKILKPHAHLHIIGRKSTKFQVNSMKGVGGIAETRSRGGMDGRRDRRPEGRTEVRNNSHTDGQWSFVVPLRLCRVTFQTASRTDRRTDGQNKAHMD